jgi:hypothetical protein
MPKELLTEEYCPNCERESRIRATIHPVPKCKYCKAELVPCSACETIYSNHGCGDCKHGSNFVLHPNYHKPEKDRIW